MKNMNLPFGAATSALFGALGASMEELRNSVSDVKYAPSDVAERAGVEVIQFRFRNTAYQAELRGVLASVMLGSPEQNARIAVRCLLDRVARPLSQSAPSASAKPASASRRMPGQPRRALFA